MVKGLIHCATGEAAGRQRFALKKEPAFDNFHRGMIPDFPFRDFPLEIFVKEDF